MTRQAIKRAIIIGFNPATYTASVLLLEATSATLNNVPVANHVDGTSGLVGAYAAVLFFDEVNYSDAVVIATYANGSNGLPAIPPGRTTFITGVLEVNAVVIGLGATTSFAMSGIPAGALGIVYKAFFTSATVGAFIQIGPKGGNLALYEGIGQLTVANEVRYGDGVVQVDASGSIGIKANTGACTVTLHAHGYII